MQPLAFAGHRLARLAVVGLVCLGAISAARAQDGTFEQFDFDSQSSSEPEAPVVQPAPSGPKPRVKDPVAVFSGLDKITGRITSFDVYVDETVQFGALQVTPKACYSSAEGEAARTDAFVEVDEITLDRQIRRIFTGWMFADSPGLNAVEHPVYDVWLKSCKSESAVPAPAG